MGDLTQAIAFALGVAGPLTVLVVWIVRQVLKVSGTAAKVVTWIIALLIALYAVIHEHLIPSMLWTSPETVIASIATLGAITTGIVAIATAVYKVIDIRNWTTADKRTPITLQ
jgi:hypothetical protein